MDLYVCALDVVCTALQNYVKEEMLPEWLDLVVWGHEHECKGGLEDSIAGSFKILQAGSTVATSLVSDIRDIYKRHCRRFCRRQW